MKSSGANWKKTFADYIWHTLGFEPCVGAGENVYLKLEKYGNEHKYCSYIVVYVYNALCIHKYPDKYLNLVGKKICLNDPPDFPTMYLGADISKFVIPNNGNGVTFWDISADSHVEKLLQVIEAKLKDENVR